MKYLVCLNVKADVVLRKIRSHANPSFFGCTFIKADGTIRTGVFSFGVRKFLSGGPAKNTNDFIVADVNVIRKGENPYRTIKADKVRSITFSGVRYICL